MKSLHETFQASAKEAGLVYLGESDLNVKTDFARFQSWLEEGNHAEMSFLERNQTLREDPRLLLASAQSALVFGYLYRHRQAAEKATSPKIARYAQLRDYHRFLRERCESIVRKLESLEEVLQALQGSPLETRILVDSAPALERALARKAGQGFIGKNTCYIHPQAGSFLLLTVILSNLPPKPAKAIGLKAPKLDNRPDSKPANRSSCGSCRRCQVHCPTGALREDYSLDARLCLSYWTIEHRGLVPEKFWPHFADYVFGCDICQNVCPFNRLVPTNPDESLIRLPEMPDLKEVSLMSQKDYETLFGGTPMTRAKRTGLRRNALIALHARQDPRLPEVLDALNQETDLDPVLIGTIAQVRAFQQKGNETT